MSANTPFVLANATPYTWVLTGSESSKPMSAWSFPDLPSGISPPVHIEFQEGSVAGDTAAATYTFGDNSGFQHQFQIQARYLKAGTYAVQAYFQNLETPNHPKGSTIPLVGSFVLAGDGPANFVSSFPPSGWMSTYLDLLTKYTLREICLPGSHDAGMSVLQGGTAGVNRDNVITQDSNILFQLGNGVRYFDIRPVISAGRYLTGHYSQVPVVGAWVGGNGQSMESIVAEVNDFTSREKELIILHLTHTRNTDVGFTSYRPFNKEEWQNFVGTLLSKINYRYISSSSTNPVDLTALTVGEYITHQPAVLVVCDCDPDFLPSGSGLYTNANFPLTDDYADTEDLETMKLDQFTKMRKNRPAYNSPCFLLSWTLTQNPWSAVGAPGGTSIFDLARRANPELVKVLFANITANNMNGPNIILEDFVGEDAVAMAIAVNFFVHGRKT
ncbi:PLC-like phosphodiesterase [Pluteus cervinus]|uniref:PLC-like phosphodiesterase n=1 Tax=Pluteus cervinus TaxID=181527 RepID=A0ACD3ABN5_9AGAR|nr:PLC-like phosphodiesterase [Pluteus cervinus]